MTGAASIFAFQKPKPSRAPSRKHITLHATAMRRRAPYAQVTAFRRIDVANIIVSLISIFEPLALNDTFARYL